jgi:CRP-like cAMP-binding protein
VIQKGTAADCLFIVYKGRIGIYIAGDWKANIESGGYFGEMALDKDSVRSADAIAETDTTLFILKDIDYKRIVYSLKNLEKSLNLKLIVNIPLFVGMSYNKMQALINSCALAVFHPNDLIFDIESLSTSFYIIQKGTVELQIFVKVEKVNKWPVGTRSWNVRQIKQKYAVLFKTCKEGNYFGEYEILKGCERKMRAVVMETCKCLVINSEEIKEHFWMRDEKKLT